MIDPVTGTLVLGGINAASQAVQNIGNRRWSEKMYQRQNEDQLKFWNMQNEYNSPAAQMERLKAAGLNPHLIYKGGATSDASPISVARPQPYEGKAPQLEAGPIISSYFQSQMQREQFQNFEMQRRVWEQEALLKAQQQANLVIKNAQGQFDLQMKKELKETQLQTAQENLNKLRIGNQVTLNEDERAAAQNAQSLREGVQRILNMRIQRLEAMKRMQKMDAEIGNIGKRNQIIDQQITNLKRSYDAVGKDIELRDLDIQLKKDGVQPTDAIFWRWMQKSLNKWSDDPESILNPQREKGLPWW